METDAALPTNHEQEMSEVIATPAALTAITTTKVTTATTDYGDIEREEGLLTCLFDSGSLAWWELEDMRMVSKTFYRLIIRAKPYLPDWANMTRLLSTKNGYDTCDCGEKWRLGHGCDKPESTVDDPRVQSSYESLSPFDQFQVLLDFHQTCIRNLLEFYPADLSEECANGADFSWDTEEMQSMNEYNPKAANLLYNVVSLMLAESDLEADSPYWFQTAFSGDSLDPYVGSSYRSCFCENVQCIVNRRAAEEGEIGFEGIYDEDLMYSSQFKNLDKSLLEVIDSHRPSERVFGPLADSIDVFGQHRSIIQSQLEVLFPLNWMPFFDE